MSIVLEAKKTEGKLDKKKFRSPGDKYIKTVAYGPDNKPNLAAQIAYGVATGGIHPFIHAYRNDKTNQVMNEAANFIEEDCATLVDTKTKMDEGKLATCGRAYRRGALPWVLSKNLYDDGTKQSTNMQNFVSAHTNITEEKQAAARWHLVHAAERCGKDKDLPSDLCNNDAIRKEVSKMENLLAYERKPHNSNVLNIQEEKRQQRRKQADAMWKKAEETTAVNQAYLDKTRPQRIAAEDSRITGPTIKYQNMLHVAPEPQRKLKNDFENYQEYSSNDEEDLSPERIKKLNDTATKGLQQAKLWEKTAKQTTNGRRRNSVMDAWT